MTDLRERVAEAIYMAHWDPGPESLRGLDYRFPPMWDAASSEVKEWARVQADAALEAIAKAKTNTDEAA